MFPIRDDQPRYSTPYVNSFLIGLNVVIYFFEWMLQVSDPESLKTLVYQFAVVPAHLTAFLSGSPKYPLVAVVLPFVTSMFLHGGWMHVLGNVWFLYIFGDNIEDYLGHFKYLLFYLLVGVLAMAVQVAIDPTSRVPALGASGAIAGVMGAYLVLYPRARVLTWVFVVIIYLPAWIMLGYWFVLNFLSGTASSMTYEGRSMGGVAFWAHVGGFIAGVVLIKVFPQRARRYPYAFQ